MKKGATKLWILNTIVIQKFVNNCRRPIGAAIASFVDRLGPVPADLHPNCAIGTTVAPTPNPYTGVPGATPSVELPVEHVQGTESVDVLPAVRQTSGDSRVNSSSAAEDGEEPRPVLSVDETTVVKSVREEGDEK